VEFEDAMSSEMSKETWERMYKLAKMGTASEDERRALRTAVYTYCLKNGTSREGDYTLNMVLSTGKNVGAEVIPKAANRTRIRKFLRANMNESYEFFKNSRCMEADERFVAKMAAYNIAPENGFATADWMDECPKFTPAETRAHEAMRARGIERARRARGGQSLETVEQDRRDDAMRVQGPAYEHEGRVEF